MNQASINVLIVTYKQADVIGRNLESILKQKEYGLNKIIISDDCSPDNNWEVIQSYVQKYPDIIVAYRNNPNLGIYGNSNKLAALCGDADLYCWLEGDDALCDGFFKSMQEYIRDNNVDITQPVGIFGDYIAIDTRGKQSLMKNDFVLKGYDPMGAYLRGMATWRGSLFSRSVLNKFTPVETDKGLLLAETLFDSQFFKYINNAHYNPIAGTIYYTGIGVSVTWGLIDSYSSYKIEDNITMWQYLLDNKVIVEERDINWAQSAIAYSSCLKNSTLKYLPDYMSRYFMGLSGYKRNIFKLLLKTGYLMLLVGRKYMFEKKQ